MPTPAFVILKEAVLPDEMVLVDTLRRRHPDLSWDPGSTAQSNRRPDEAIFIRAGDRLMAVMSLPAPIPIDLQDWQRATRHWPEALEAVTSHQAHLVVSSLGSASEGAEPPLDVMQDARLTTAAVGGLIEVLPACLGVLWQGKVARSSAHWEEASRRAFAPAPDHPFELWIETIFYRSGNSLGAYTEGLSAFIGREIEFEVDGLDQEAIARRVDAFASYLIANGIDENTEDGKVYRDHGELGNFILWHRMSRFGARPVISFSSPLNPATTKVYPIIPRSIASNHPLLILLAQLGLFDPAQPENLVRLRPDHYISEVRVALLDDELTKALTTMMTVEGYGEADTDARRALARRDMALARSLLEPWGKKVDTLLQACQLGLHLRDIHLFVPAPPQFVGGGVH
ncbi:hypothetical protein TSA1_34500 [Bradyrhizobium nitroreducens]|uniref:Uncharacterized protein n=1 Tax=Bradyrhizobium nitroreducens TaxID=709803 RepID=A0A2M6UKY8_9BRAD|nr:MULTISPECIES: hypothetical protein [Bradyrhizobium]PIT05284.1 hypothetical protein TSA1_34500 [Bradyrhizobium nitroreducens]TQF37265.1 hypothetical protein UNPF46_20065 [Bradyrhizobium sp. UNPF46]